MIKYIIGILIVGTFVKLGINQTHKPSVTFEATMDSLGNVVETYDFGATLHISTHDDVNELLDNIRKKYEGQAVILDLWGTFCKPCLSDFKNSPEIKAKLKEVGVHMVYLCAGKSSNPTQWKKVIEADQLIGDHIYMDRKLTDAYMQKFEIRNYPNYILIDRNGEFKQNIISAVGDINLEKFQKHL